MLDFYFISDDQDIPDYPEEGGLTFVGKMDAKTFRNLQSKRVIDACFFIFSDFRWTSEVGKLQRDKIFDTTDTDAFRD